MKKLVLSTVLLSMTTASAWAGQFLTTDGVPVHGSYIIVLKEKRSSFAQHMNDVKDIASRHNAKVAAVFENHVLNGAALKMSEQDARELARRADVDFVEQDAVISAFDTQVNPPSWGLDRIDQANLPLNQAYSSNSTGAGVTAYVIDTGIVISHSDFTGRASVGFDAFGGDGIDCNGHGTHVAGTIGGETYGVAKDVNLVAVRVLDCNGSGSTSGVINGISWVTNNAQKPAVANMSLGGAKSKALNTAVANSIKSDIAYAVAAGNNNTNACNASPASEPTALTVGATQSDDKRASYSNYGSCLDLFAPGTDITSTWSDGLTKTISGTSMATPHVAGVAALYLQANPMATVSQVSSALINATVANKVTNAGLRSPNRLLQLSSF